MPTRSIVCVHITGSDTPYTSMDSSDPNDDTVRVASRGFLRKKLRILIQYKTITLSASDGKRPIAAILDEDVDISGVDDED